MRTRSAARTNRDGSVLMVTLFSAVLIGTVLASYLTLIRHQDIAVARSQGWNAALAVAEAGVEEALAQMNAGAGSFSYDLSANGWGPPSGSGHFNLQQRTLAGGSYDVKFFTNSSSPYPTIYSTGYVTIPAISATLERRIKVSTKAIPLINAAAVAKYGLAMSSGSGFLADSFNSADPAHSDSAHYPSANLWKTLTNGDVASVYGPVNFGGGPYIKGDLYLGPAVATNSIAANQVSGKIYTDFNADYPDVAAPPGAPNGLGWLQAPDSGTMHEFTSGGNYWVNDSKDITVRRGVSGISVTLYVMTTNFFPGKIEIESSNNISSTLTIYQVAGTASFPGSGKMAVQSQRADNFWYFGMSGVTSVTNVGGGNDFFGVIYAPSANLILNGGWNQMDFIGACVGKTITMDEPHKFHFDENLLKVGPIRGFVATAWKELKLPNEL